MTSSDGSGELVRAVTHSAIAPVARLMGYTPNGLRDLIQQFGVTNDWQMIGVTRASSGNERVNCRRANSGRFEFSIGNDAYELAGDAKAAREMRRQIAESVVRVGQLRRETINPRFNSSDQASGVDDSIIDQGEQAPTAMIITPVAPRGPHPFGSC